VKEIDARGLAYPAPVLTTKAAVKQENLNTVRVIVDNEAAVQNVSRFLEFQGFKTSIQQKGNDYAVIGTCETGIISKSEPVQKAETDQKNIMVMIASDRMGFGDDELGRKLLVNFITTLKEMGPELWRLVFVNNGVKLTIEGSEVLPILKEYDAEGLHILVCGTCLNHFNLLDKKQVGETTNMLDIVTAMQLADKVINI
jgi:selenium metabolism protein YedF